MGKIAKYLKWIMAGTALLGTGVIIGRRWKARGVEVEYGELRKRLAKFEDYFAVANKWLKNRNNGINVSEYFQKNGYENIAIYGMGELGRRLYEELKMQGVMVEYAFDRNAQRIDPKLKVCSVEGTIPPVDVIVITPMFDYSTIEESLKKVTDCDIVSISDVVTR